MRSEKEIRSFLEDLEAVINMPGDGGMGEFVMMSHTVLLRWVLGENNPHHVGAVKDLREAVSSQTVERN